MPEVPITIHLFHPTLARGGGMERYAETIVREFRRRGNPVVFHARKVDSAAAADWGVRAAEHRVPGFLRKLRDYYFSRAVERARAELRDDRIEISLWRTPVRDLMICGGTHLGYLRQAGRLAGVFDWLQVRLERQAYAAARTVVSHSDLCTRELRELYGISEGRIVTLYPPADAQFKPPGPGRRAEARGRFGFPEGRVVFLFPSTGHTRKGLEPIREALGEFAAEVVLAVAGRACGSAKSGWVRDLGYVPDMAAAYHAADFTVLGSSYEPFGLVGLESVLCGTRLMFERGIGCLPAIRPEFATLFDVTNRSSLRQATAACIQMARENRHRIESPAEALTYDSSPARHVDGLLRAAGRVL